MTEEDKVEEEETGVAGIGYWGRDSMIKKREDAGNIEFKLLANTLNPSDAYYVRDMKWLINLKCIISRQLPKMPKEYIVRLTMDRDHESMAILRRKPGLPYEKAEVIGGCVFRPFYHLQIAEIVFLAIDSQQQVKGYGTRLMNKLKSHLSSKGVQFFLTYADNQAIEYFKKQGFCKDLRLPKSRYEGHIKDYKESKLMECYLDTKINYQEISKILSAQRQILLDAVFQRSYYLSKPYSLLQQREGCLDDVKGLREAGWTKEVVQEHRRIENNRTYQERLALILNEMINQQSSKFFLSAVKKQTAPTYYDTIKEPMWIEKIQQKLKNGEYEQEKPEKFIYDVNLIFSNARQFNQATSIYFKKANELEARVKPLIKQLTDLPETKE